MKRSIRALFLLLSLSLVATPAIAQDEILKADWVMPAQSVNVPSQGIVFMEPTLYPGSTSYLTSYGTYKAPDNPALEKRSEHICKSVNTESCATDNSITYNAYIPVCANSKSINCIEDFWLILNGKKFNPTLDSYMPASSPLHFKEDVAANLPEGKSSSIWKIKEIELGQSELLFSVSAVFKGTTDAVLRKFSKPSISVVVDPIVKVSGNYSIPEASKTGNGWSIGGCLQEGCGDNNIGFCAAVDVRSCAKRINNIDGIRYGIKIRVTDPPITWIHGRLLNTEFNSENFSNGVVWSIEAEPVTLPVISGWIPNTEALQKLNLTISRQEETSWTGPISSGEGAIQQFNKWIPYLGDKAQALQKRWSVGTILSGQVFNGKTMEQCLSSNEIAGVVMSNATVYQGEPPIWNASDLTLDYKVAAPHYTPGGNEYLGSYQLKINNDFARCIYGLQNVPLVATISIVGNDGVTKVGTSSISMGSKWINFNVSGFTFSAPTIKVQLTEAKRENTIETKVEAQQQSVPAQVSSKVSQKKSITCIKGKTAKKITAVNPKCPAVYKKK
jgi:hypothetical protein